MGYNNKDLGVNYIYITYFTLTMEPIYFLFQVFPKVSLRCFVWPHLDFCDKYNHCLYLLQFLQLLMNVVVHVQAFKFSLVSCDSSA